MVPKFNTNGWSFRGLISQYLMHDMGHAKTSDRVAWTHTINLANDDIDHAVAEMIGTAKHAEALKARAGIHRGGTPLEKPVKHFSLSWHPSESPDKAEMIQAASDFLNHMGWQDFQAIIISHNDRPHKHVHVILNQVHPERGTKLDDGFEKFRASTWALNYELSRGLVFCAQRRMDGANRDPAMTRPAWEWSRKAVETELECERQRAPHDADYMSRIETRREIEAEEWRLLKDQQRAERTQWFADGKEAYKTVNRAVYKEVRAEMREDWASYYAAKRDGLDFETLQQVRASLIARQNTMLEERREAATAVLRAERDLIYRALLDEQKAQRTELVGRQELGLRSPHLLDATYTSKDEKVENREPDKAGEALDRFNVRRGRSHEKRGADRSAGRTLASERGSSVYLGGSRDPPSVRPRGPSRDIGSALAGGLLGLIGSLGESMTGGPGKEPPRAAARDVDPLDRFGVRRGRPPDPAIEKAQREKREREDWDAWKAKRELDRSRSGR